MFHLVLLSFIHSYHQPHSVVFEAIGPAARANPARSEVSNVNADGEMTRHSRW